MENKPTELPEQTIPELALVLANNPGVREVQIVDASNHVAIVALSLLKLRSDQGGFVYQGDLIVKAPKKQKRFKDIEEERVHLGLDELDATEYGSRYLVTVGTSDEGMSKKGCIQQLRDAFEREQSNLSATDKLSLMPYANQILRIRMHCERWEPDLREFIPGGDCASVVWNKHIKGFVWFDVEPLVPLAPPWNEGSYEGYIRVRPFGGSILYKEGWFNERLGSPSLAMLPADVWDHTAGFLGLNTKNRTRRQSYPHTVWTRRTKRKFS